MTVIPPLETLPEKLGTARNPVHNPLTLMWAVLIGLPGALFMILLFKLYS